jgi:5-formyltetrahydrofolate cyclo-ligase
LGFPIKNGGTFSVAPNCGVVLFSRIGRMEPNDKADWRRQVRESVRAMSAEERAAASVELCQRLRSEAIWQSARSVLCFAPLQDEPDIMPLIEEALSARKTLALPRFDAGTGRYSAACVSARSELVAGAFGALEPRAGCPALALNPLDLVLVPGVAFDFAGRRLGRGKGFYDRLLAEVRGHKCGVAFDGQLVAQLPEEPHDVRVDSILTPTRWLPARAD